MPLGFSFLFTVPISLRFGAGIFNSGALDFPSFAVCFATSASPDVVGLSGRTVLAFLNVVYQAVVRFGEHRLRSTIVRRFGGLFDLLIGHLTNSLTR